MNNKVLSQLRGTSVHPTFSQQHATHPISWMGTFGMPGS